MSRHCCKAALFLFGLLLLQAEHILAKDYYELLQVCSKPFAAACSGATGRIISGAVVYIRRSLRAQTRRS